MAGGEPGVLLKKANPINPNKIRATNIPMPIVLLGGNESMNYKFSLAINSDRSQHNTHVYLEDYFCKRSHFSASKAAAAPKPAAVTTCIYCLSCTSPAVNTPSLLVL